MAVSELNTDPIEALLETIRQFQRDEGWTDKQVAAKLGVPRSTWSAAKNGLFRPGLTFVQKCAASPEFRQQARAILLPGGAANGARS